MSNIFFDLLVETNITGHIFSKVIKEYLFERNVKLNHSQIFLLHFLIKKGGKTSMSLLEGLMSPITKNSCYNINNLAEREYISKINGDYLDRDGRKEYIFITQKGIDLYKDIGIYTGDRANELIKRLKWDKEKHDGYMRDLMNLRLIQK
jgi:DNA-binding MarR family transcriptional regulator